MERGEVVSCIRRACNIQFNSPGGFSPSFLFNQSLIHSNYHDVSSYDHIMDYTKGMESFHIKSCLMQAKENSCIQERENRERGKTLPQSHLND